MGLTIFMCNLVNKPTLCALFDILYFKLDKYEIEYQRVVKVDFNLSCTCILFKT